MNVDLLPDQPGPPVPARDPLYDFFWAGARERKLLIQRCDSCGSYIHLPRPVCRVCRSFDLTPTAVSGRGTLYSYTETHKAFHPFWVNRVPFVLATVALVEQPGLHVLSNLVGTGTSEPVIGMSVEVDYEWLSPDFAIPVFRPFTGAQPR